MELIPIHVFADKTELFLLDCDYIQPQFAGCYLLVAPGSDKREALLIETGTIHNVATICNALQTLKATLSTILVTHVHLDHAAGAGKLMELHPNAQLWAHPRAVRHLVTPERLEQSARLVYGDQTFNKLYGERLLAIDEKRVTALTDAQVVAWSNHSLHILHTRGHANHHLCVQIENIVFTGDTFGLSYPRLKINQPTPRLIIPSTSPTDFDPLAALSSLERLVATQASFAALTHFGLISDLANHAEQLTVHLKEAQRLLIQYTALAHAESPNDPNSWIKDHTAAVTNQLIVHLQKYTHAHDLELDAEDLKLLALDLKINAQGILFSALSQKSSR